jgi:hypothetical protein
MQKLKIIVFMIIILVLFSSLTISPFFMVFAQQSDGLPVTSNDLPDKIGALEDTATVSVNQTAADIGNYSKEFAESRDPGFEELDIPNLKQIQEENVRPSEYLGPASKENTFTYTINNETLNGEEFLDVGQQAGVEDAIASPESSIGNETPTANNALEEYTNLHDSYKPYGDLPHVKFTNHIIGHPADDSAARFRLMKYVGDDHIQTYPDTCNLALARVSCLWLEPAVASNGRITLYTGNLFVTRSTNSGTDWSSIGIDYSQGFYHARLPPGTPNNTGDNDVAYSSHISKFIWFRQGSDGRFNIGLSSDLSPNSWTYVNVEANNFRSDLNLDTILQANSLQSPRGDCPDETRRECNINFWWDFPQIALTNRYLYVSTNIFLGCGREGLTNPSCSPSDNHFYGAAVFRIGLDDLNRGLVNQQYLQQSEHQYYDSSGTAFLTLTQGTAETMYWASLTGSDQIKICSWMEDAPSATCTFRTIPEYNTGQITCRGSDNRDWCAANVPGKLETGWVYEGKVGFLWNVAADPPSTNPINYPHPWMKAAVFTADNNLNYLREESARYSLASDHEWIQHAFVSPNRRGIGLMAWYGDSNSPPGILSAITDSYSPLGWEKWKWLRPSYDGPTSTNLPNTDIRLGDYLRVRPYAGLSNLWEASAYYVTGNAINPTVNAFYVIFGRPENEGEYRSLSNGPPDCSGVTPSQSVLWPPNHRMMSITIQNVVDPDGDPLSIRITSIRQDEPTRGQGSGDSSPDGAGIGTSTAQVRAETAGNGDGRVYHVIFTANDGRGGECTGEVLVSVPHDQRGALAGDTGARFDSTQ